ncbi:MAG: hypothetical protein M3176_18410, partial [Chloroflexota bacterium]|nr:hypothetical protein [Chloroflexota bacterium]
VRDACAANENQTIIESDEAAEEAGDHYAWLRQRTYLYLRENNGAAHEDAVIRHVFGSGGPPALWRTLIRTVLDEPATFRLRPDMHWALVEQIAAPLRWTISRVRANTSSSMSRRRVCARSSSG